MQLPFDNGYARLSPRFFARVEPSPVRRPQLLRLNGPLAELLGLDVDALSSVESVEGFAGNRLFDGSEPIALAYAGHQFGGFSPQLGDGRAVLLGEVVGADGVRRDLQLKGSGRTPFSRGGDGRAAIGPVLREYLLSEAMEALGVPTTRALAAVSTGEPVYREEVLPGAVLTRVARSHLRVGTFEFFAARRDREALEELTAYALERLYPDSESGEERPALALLESVIEAQAQLVARWMGIGFVHGVMNTDNTSIAGETLDYGPAAFLDAYDPGRTFSSIDQGHRYAFGNQPRIALWNLARLAEAVLPLVDDDEKEAVRLATERLDGFSGRFAELHGAVLRAKLGLVEAHEEDLSLAAGLLERMGAEKVDYTLAFRRLMSAAEVQVEAPAGGGSDAGGSGTGAGLLELFDDRTPLEAWLRDWRARLDAEATPTEERVEVMRRANPAFIPRNHRVEEMITAAMEGDLAPFERLLTVLAHPYDDQPDALDLAEPPGDEQWRYQTFCGT